MSSAGSATERDSPSTGSRGFPLSTVDKRVMSVSKRSGLSDTAYLPVVDVESGTVQGLRDVRGYCRGDDRLLGLAGDERELITAADVQFGEHIVEHQNRFLTAAGQFVAQQLVGPQPQRERRRPRLAVAGVAAHRQIAQPQSQLVAMRSDEVDSALELL